MKLNAISIVFTIIGLANARFYRDCDALEEGLDLRNPTPGTYSFYLDCDDAPGDNPNLVCRTYGSEAGGGCRDGDARVRCRRTGNGLNCEIEVRRGCPGWIDGRAHALCC